MEMNDFDLWAMIKLLAKYTFPAGDERDINFVIDLIKTYKKQLRAWHLAEIEDLTDLIPLRVKDNSTKIRAFIDWLRNR